MVDSRDNTVVEHMGIRTMAAVHIMEEVHIMAGTITMAAVLIMDLIIDGIRKKFKNLEEKSFSNIYLVDLIDRLSVELIYK